MGEKDKTAATVAWEDEAEGGPGQVKRAVPAAMEDRGALADRGEADRAATPLALPTRAPNPSA